MTRIPNKPSHGDRASETVGDRLPRGALLQTIRGAVIRSHERQRAAPAAGAKHGVDGFHQRYRGMPLPSAND